MKYADRLEGAFTPHVQTTRQDTPHGVLGNAEGSAFEKILHDQAADPTPAQIKEKTRQVEPLHFFSTLFSNLARP